MRNKVEIANHFRGNLPRMPFGALKMEILGSEYELSIALVSSAQSRRLNQKHRKRDKPANILAFPLSKNSGELVLAPALVAKEAQEFAKTPREFLGFLVIHGMLHLKGMRHGAIMERLELKYYAKYFDRHRRGHHGRSGRGGRISERRKKA